MSNSHRLNPDLVSALKRLKLGPVVDTLPDRLVLADKQDLSFEQLLLLVFSDEVQRRDSTAAERRAQQADLDPEMRMECFDKSAKVTYDKRLLAELSSLRFLGARQHIVILGPAGVGKTFIASALGQVAPLAPGAPGPGDCAGAAGCGWIDDRR
jgi:DNA replication protein DnaC